MMMVALAVHSCYDCLVHLGAALGSSEVVHHTESCLTLRFSLVLCNLVENPFGVTSIVVGFVQTVRRSLLLEGPPPHSYTPPKPHTRNSPACCSSPTPACSRFIPACCPPLPHTCIFCLLPTSYLHAAPLQPRSLLVSVHRVCHSGDEVLAACLPSQISTGAAPPAYPRPPACCFHAASVTWRMLLLPSPRRMLLPCCFRHLAHAAASVT